MISVDQTGPGSVQPGDRLGPGPAGLETVLSVHSGWATVMTHSPQRRAAKTHGNATSAFGC